MEPDNNGSGSSNEEEERDMAGQKDDVLIVDSCQEQSSLQEDVHNAPVTLVSTSNVDEGSVDEEHGGSDSESPSTNPLEKSEASGKMSPVSLSPRASTVYKPLRKKSLSTSGLADFITLRVQPETLKIKTFTKKKMQGDDDSSSESEPKEAAMEMSEEVISEVMLKISHIESGGDVSIDEPLSDLRLRVSPIEKDSTSEDLSEAKLQVSHIHELDRSKESSELQLQVSNIDEMSRSEEPSEIQLQVSYIDEDTTSMEGSSQGLLLSNAMKTRARSGSKKFLKSFAHQLHMNLSTASTPAGGYSQLQKPKSKCHQQRSITFNIPTAEEKHLPSSGHKEHSGSHDSGKSTNDSSKSSSNGLSATQLPRPHPTDSSSLHTNISSSYAQPTDSDCLNQAHSDGPTPSSSVYDGNRIRLSLPMEFGEDGIFPSSIADPRHELLKLPPKPQKKFAKSEEYMKFKKEGFERSDQSSYTSESLRGFVFPQRSRANVEDRSRTSKISKLTEDTSQMDRRDTQVSFGTTEAVDFTDSEDEIVSSPGASTISDESELQRRCHLNEMKKIRASARNWVAKSKLTVPGSSMQKTRPLIEIPRALKLDIWKEAHPIVEKMYELYKSALGPNDNLTQGTLDHITANRDKFKPEEN